VTAVRGFVRGTLDDPAAMLLPAAAGAIAAAALPAALPAWLAAGVVAGVSLSGST
jgi:hypothetical protein